MILSLKTTLDSLLHTGNLIRSSEQATDVLAVYHDVELIRYLADAHVKNLSAIGDSRGATDLCLPAGTRPALLSIHNAARSLAYQFTDSDLNTLQKVDAEAQASMKELARGSIDAHLTSVRASAAENSRERLLRHLRPSE